MPVPVDTFAPAAKEILPVDEVIEALLVLTAPSRTIDDWVAVTTRVKLPVIVEENVKSPVPVWFSVVAASNETGAPNVAADPCVVFVPLRTMRLPAVNASVPGAAVGPTVTPDIVKLCPAVKLWLPLPDVRLAPELKVKSPLELIDMLLPIEVPIPRVWID